MRCGNTSRFHGYKKDCEFEIQNCFYLNAEHNIIHAKNSKKRPTNLLEEIPPNSDICYWVNGTEYVPIDYRDLSGGYEIMN